MCQLCTVRLGVSISAHRVCHLRLSLSCKVCHFRLDFDGALSYFVGGNENYPEDHGFAIKPWSNVRWESVGTKITDHMAVAMGNYFFTPAEGGDDVKVEYSFAYTVNADGRLKIILHGSHLPYNPAA